MDIYNVLKNRKSIRKYQHKAVAPKLLTKILESAVQTSSSGNMQTYSIIVSRDREMRERLYPLHFKQEMLLDAPIFITFCADFNRMRRWLEISDAPENFDNFMSFMISAIDAILVSQSVALLAESEGLGICYMGTTLANCEKIGEVLKLPENVVPVVGFSLGYPDEAPKSRDRLPLGSLVHYETYTDQTSEIVSNTYRERNEDGMKRYMDHPELRERVLAENIENLAQVYTKLKYTRESHLDYSDIVLNYLHKQNFMNHGRSAL